jgi:hypothetical protein
MARLAAARRGRAPIIMDPLIVFEIPGAADQRLLGTAKKDVA